MIFQKEINKIDEGCGKYLGAYMEIPKEYENASEKIRKEKSFSVEVICGNQELCEICKAKLQQHEETSKAKDEEFIKILDEIEKNNWMYADMDEAEFWVTSTITQEEANIRANHTSAIIEEIKQRIKEEWDNRYKIGKENEE